MALPFYSIEGKEESTTKFQAPFKSDDVNAARSHNHGDILSKPRGIPTRFGSKTKPCPQLSLEFISLRHVIFDINPKSATPIARILRAELTDREILDLLEAFHDSAPEEASISHAEATSHFLWQQDEPVTKRTIGCAKLHRLIDDARCKHAVRLRDGGLVDVEIMYVNHPNLVMTFKEDKLAIENAGGEPYHLWPLNSTMTQMGMCAVVERAGLESIYPEERRQGGIIKITANTEPAQYGQSETQPESEQGGNIFPHLIGGGLLSPVDSISDDRRNFANQEIEHICNRGRSISIRGAMNVPKDRPWPLYSAIQRLDQAQPQWPVNDMPFAKHYNSNDQDWWIDDFVERSKLLRKRDEKTWVEAVNRPGQFQRVLSQKKPEESRAGVDYELVPTLGDCKTYTDNRNYDWHQSNLGELDSKATAKDCNQSYDEYKNEVKMAQEITGHLREAKERARNSSDDRRLQDPVKDMTRNESLAYRRARMTRDKLVEQRKARGGTDISVYAGLDDDLSPSSSPEDISEAVQVQRRQQKRQQERECVRKRLASVPPIPAADPGRTPHPQQVIAPTPAPWVIPGSQQRNTSQRVSAAPVQRQRRAQTDRPPRLVIPKQQDAIPFPASEDPFGGRTVVEPEPARQPEEKTKAAGEAKRSLAHILADTGIQRKQYVWQLPPAETPITPPQWNGTPGEGQEYNLAMADMKADDYTVREPAVVEEERDV